MYEQLAVLAVFVFLYSIVSGRLEPHSLLRADDLRHRRLCHGPGRARLVRAHKL
jgi:hypothetical protein